MRKQLVALCVAFMTLPALAAIDITDNFSVSGFGSTSWARSDNSTPLLVNREIGDENCWDCDTVLGIQADYYQGGLHASAQVVKRPQKHWSDPHLEWAYVGYSLSDWQATIGRQRLPYGLASEYFYVGHAYTAARLQQDYYNSLLGITSYDGVSLKWSSPLNDSTLVSLVPFYGMGTDGEYIRYTSDLSLKFKSDYTYGINGSLEGDQYKLNLVYFRSKYQEIARFDQLGLVIDDTPKVHFELYSLGFEYDFQPVKVTIEGQKNDENAAWYLQADYRLQSLVPYVSYGQSFNGDYDMTNDTYTVGLRYDLIYNVSLNAEWNRLQSQQNVNGTYYRGAFLDVPSEPSANLYTVMVNFVF
ncbi:sulfate ABC transporter permease [Vibrio parahaemolyticus]|uniref:sulfate ABC transporter permease n=1 Tax=Vibrio mediterranei TaxID=689 RepID=UPI0040697008